MERPIARVGRRRFVHQLGLATAAGVAVSARAVDAGQSGQVAGTIAHAGDGLRIPPTADGRVVTIKVDSEATPGVRMSMIAEDLPPGSAIRVHLHQHEDEVITIRTGTGIATLGDREVPVSPGSTIYVPQGVWHGLRNNGSEMLGMSAVYSPAGFEQSFKGRLLNPNRTPAETEAHRKKFGIVYRR